MNNILPDIETLESVTKVKINDLAEQVKAVYFYFNKDKIPYTLMKAMTSIFLFHLKTLKILY
ncbi:hypothetical protein DY130_03665 [Apilactobacillus micheneri]|uniref:Uncharacterized protein n=1 Tax=Apilactobacillus micheneri TaxID=1899430 RepID=A0A9Q8IP22_9LACO|nr:hypothetical protein [Apilactobacillus micheneri]TPR39945.1 hypothetical protein DY121_03670 [Apilactobacillus micheneri]TPR41758.1 hypothetical protein DY123_04300 [Apilactobacillus micheneri]TPR44147.1 hypothetical protein DY130_03665 [Apilactobacillus micheneri]TPR45771.1 hypothetical protein DY128_03665 [Apilactobacillus micheneri]